MPYHVYLKNEALQSLCDSGARESVSLIQACIYHGH